MYRSDLNAGDKGGAILAVVAVHVLLVFMLLHLSGRIDLTEPQSMLRVFDVTEDVPPPPEIEQPQQQQPKPKKEAEPSKASPSNVKSEATEIAPPKPRIALPLPVPMPVSETPGRGTQSTQGASTAGPGTGAGGTGTGTGAGGTGSGGGGGYVSPPRLLTPVLTGRDFPQPLLRGWPRGGQLFLRLRISPAGSVSQCIVDRGTGVPAIDSAVCALVQQRFRYSPARNQQGEAVAGWAGYRQVPPR
jgi:protein TonB